MAYKQFTGNGDARLPGGLGGHSGLNRSRGAEAMNAKFQGQSTPFGAKKGGGQLQTKNILGALADNLCLYSLYFIRYMAFFI